MIGGYLMSNLSRNLVHLRWLLKLVDFRTADEFSWGSVVLATLYWEMCGATLPNKAKIRGCLSLLQSWARFCFPFLRPRVNQPYTFSLKTRWNHPSSYVRIPTAFEDIRLLLDQRLEAQKNRYDHIPIREPIIVPELACAPNYMPWFRIYSKPYLLSKEHRRQQIRVERERQGPLNPRRRDDGTGPSTTPQPLQIMVGAYPSPYMYHNPYMFPFLNPIPGWNGWPDVSPFPMTLTQSTIYRPSSPDGSYEATLESSSHYQSLSPYGIQTPPPWEMQTPPHSLLYQDGSSFQHPQSEQPQPSLEQPQPPSEAEPMRNLARNR
ncbi:hypothetical protein Gogos_020948 [Gossypium gossypioides]|uniref:Aminotransferase-like plant mobile domain-containing protein n=1 Tax=Gossypium gossypioides TaxID=34282 RepID=A0A7J9CY99_GOSGO|nr:hypothetical protein [Gossypium gossypioides]